MSVDAQLEVSTRQSALGRYRNPHNADDSACPDSSGSTPFLSGESPQRSEPPQTKNGVEPDESGHALSSARSVRCLRPCRRRGCSSGGGPSSCGRGRSAWWCADRDGGRCEVEARAIRYSGAEGGVMSHPGLSLNRAVTRAVRGRRTRRARAGDGQAGVSPRWPP